MKVFNILMALISGALFAFSTYVFSYPPVLVMVDRWIVFVFAVLCLAGIAYFLNQITKR